MQYNDAQTIRVNVCRPAPQVLARKTGVVVQSGMESCLVLRHLAFEDLGTFTSTLTGHGIMPRYIDAGVDPIDPAHVLETDLLIVLGGPIGVYQVEAYPFLVDEVDAITERLIQLRPTLGICLGAQLMAKALGANVAPGSATEIGLAPIELTAAGRASPLRHLDGVNVLHWHGDNFDLPPACEHLAATAHCPFQAFSKGPNALGLQFHIEVDPARMESWLIGHTVELGKANISASSLRTQIAEFGEELERHGPQVFNEWLDGIIR